MDKYYSPLLFPVRLEDDIILVLDETELPFEEVFIPVKELNEAIKILSEMRTRAFGQVLLFFYSAVLFRKKYSLDEIVMRFKEARPTFDFSFLGELLKKETKEGKDIEEVVNHFISYFDMQRKNRMKKLASNLPNPAKILTICNINGELLYLYEELKNLEKEVIFYLSETRPYLQGSRLTFWELIRNNIPAKLICDNQAAILMQEKKINAVIVGADRCNLKNDIINKIGTYPLARLARYFDIPFYALTQYPQDLNIDSISIEERPEQEVFMFLSKKISGIRAVYPSFDITKNEFITSTYEIK
ncbi:MAG: hypothetical protein NC900_04365 [Candidatus Omnitrophica bacterium]|nr:hypothetical protein [Candidatus Omnitrophota bacterium]MCM8799940.1 hypothetical protein [Candidatus Omnitrophota bacterium]